MPPKLKNSKLATVRQQNTKKKLDRLFEEHKAFKENVPKFGSQNIVHGFNKFQHGYLKAEQMRKFGELIITEKLRRFRLSKSDHTNFERRVTALQFHPSEPHILGIGSKSGTFVVKFMRTDHSQGGQTYWNGIGPGGSITDICFDPFTPNSAFTSSIDGTVKTQNYFTKDVKTLLSTDSFESWYCSVNASHEIGLVMAGDTSGNIRILDKDLKEIFCHKLHKRKLNSVNFCKQRGWLFASASLDNTVKLWDVRKIDPKVPLHNLTHVDPVNSAYFSRTNGNRLLTTDQHNEIRVYKGPFFDLESRIPHPHRQFQHLTPIKATWHPLCDIIVVGRYPQPNWPTYLPGELNTIDLISAESRETVVQLFSLSAPKIVSLNSFNSTGEILASAMGVHVLYRKEKIMLESANTDKLESSTEEDDPPPPPKRKSTKKKTNDSPESRTMCTNNNMVNYFQ